MNTEFNRPKGTCVLCWQAGLHITCNPDGTCPHCTRQKRIPLAQRPASADKSTRRYLRSKVTIKDLMGM